uniref:ATP-dependent zinc protease family protein n=1 Tax=Aliarcobacter sp. TaxID=2321116 RepID=UPI0040472E47
MIFSIFFIINLYGKDILGAIDKVDLPLLNLENIDTRIDSGAKNSSLHCLSIEKIDEKVVKFTVLNGKTFIKPISQIKEVKSSNGISQKRIFINTEVVIFGKTYMSEVSLANRSKMSYPFLLGRDILVQNFIVDVSKENLSFDLKKKQ